MLVDKKTELGALFSGERSSYCLLFLHQLLQLLPVDLVVLNLRLAGSTANTD